MATTPLKITLGACALPLFALVVSVFTTSYDLGGYPLLQPDEGRNAGIAREMLESGAWLVPSNNGLPYLDKPAFYFRAVALSLGLFGENEASARLASVFFAWGLLLLLYRFCRRQYDGNTAAVAVLVVACTPLFIGFSRIIIFDMTLAFFVSAAIFSCFEAEESEGTQRARFYALAAACIGCAVLVKGPVGFILPTLVITVHHAFERKRGWWREAFAPRNIVIFLALVLPWFVGVSLYHPDFPYYGIVKESLQRFSSNEFHRAAPVYYYGIIIALSFFPWSVLLPESIAAAWRGRRQWIRADRLFAVWTLVVVGFFSISQSKLPGYILTAVVALGVLVGRLFAQAMTGHGPCSRIARHGALALAAAALAAAALLALPWLAPEVFRKVPPKTAAHLRDLLPMLVPTAVLCAATGLAALVAFFKRDARFVFGAFLLFPLSLVPVVTGGIDAYAEKRSARSLAEAIPPMGEDTGLVCYLCLPNGLPFYLKRTIGVVSYKDGRELESNYVRFKLENSADWPAPMIRESLFREWLEAQTQAVYLLTRTRDVDHLREILGRPELDFKSLTEDYSAAWATPGRRAAPDE